MHELSHTTSTKRATNLSSTTINTTLYDLIDAVSNEVGAEDEKLIQKTVLHLIDSLRIKFIGNRKGLMVVFR